MTTYTIRKEGRKWWVNDESIGSYELYVVFGCSPEFNSKFGTVRPSQFEVKHVRAYIKARDNNQLYMFQKGQGK